MVLIRSSRFDPVTVPLWVQVSMMSCFVLSWVISYYIGRTYFTDSDGVTNYTVGMVPSFFTLMLIEAVHVKLGKVESSASTLDPADAWSSIMCGVTQQMVTVLYKRFVVLIPYNYIFTHYALYRLDDDSWVTSFGLLIVVDFFYYWMHRIGHEVHFLWTGHGVHHSSEYYNLSTALRQSWWQFVFSPYFYLPAAFFFPIRTHIHIQAWNALFQFWVHTCTIRRMGPLEYVIVTPSHHRVHHDRRVHKNFGAIFIIWDMMFGTFLDELTHEKPREEVRKLQGRDKPGMNGEETCYFGVRAAMWTWTEPVLQTSLWYLMLRTSSYIKGPGWATTRAARLPQPHIEGVPRQRFQCTLHLIGKLFLLVQFIGTVVLALPVVAVPKEWETSALVTRLAMASLVAFTLGLILDGDKTGIVLELARGVAVALYYYTKQDPAKLGLSADSMPSFVTWHVGTSAVALVLGRYVMGKSQIVSKC
eukprot:PhM_4_TR18433/c0_g1_i2/m.28876/K15537/AGMO; alkylglycerol monooxygenase